MSNVGDKLTEWDTCQLIEGDVESRLADWELYYQDQCPDEDTVRNDVAGDADQHQWWWQDFCENLTELLNARNEDGHWYASVTNFGWRSLNGKKCFTAENGQEFLSQILPRTDCTFNVFAYGEDGVAIQNFHHDSPVGREWYHVIPAVMCEICGDVIRQEDAVKIKWDTNSSDDPDCDGGPLCQGCAERYR